MSVDLNATCRNCEGKPACKTFEKDQDLTGLCKDYKFPEALKRQPVDPDLGKFLQNMEEQREKADSLELEEVEEDDKSE